jgi:predicted secreted protein
MLNSLLICEFFVIIYKMQKVERTVHFFFWEVNRTRNCRIYLTEDSSNKNCTKEFFF